MNFINQAKLQEYNATRDIANKLIDARLLIKRNYEQPKIFKRRRGVISQDLQRIMNKENVIDYINQTEEFLNENKESNTQKKYDLANQELADWNRVKDKIIRDNMMSTEFIKDMDARMRGVIQRYLTGQTVSIKTTEKQKELIDKQKDALNKMMDDLVNLKQYSSNVDELGRINDTISYLSKLAITLNSVDYPLNDEIILGAEKKTNDLINLKRNTTNLKIEEKKEKQIENVFIERFKKLGLKNNEINTMYQRAYDQYKELERIGVRIHDSIPLIISEVDLTKTRLDKLFNIIDASQINVELLENIISNLRDFDALTQKMYEYLEESKRSTNVQPQSSQITEVEVITPEEEVERQRMLQERNEKMDFIRKIRDIFGVDPSNLTVRNVVGILRQSGSERTKKLMDEFKNMTRLENAFKTITDRLKKTQTLNIFKNYNAESSLNISAKNDIIELLGGGIQGGSNANYTYSEFKGNKNPLPRKNQIIRHFETVKF